MLDCAPDEGPGDLPLDLDLAAACLDSDFALGSDLALDLDLGLSTVGGKSSSPIASYHGIAADRDLDLAFGLATGARGVPSSIVGTSAGGGSDLALDLALDLDLGLSAVFT